MARPQKAGEEKRDQKIEVRFTLSEKKQLQITAKENSRTVSDFLRGLAINAKPLRHVPNPDRELLLKVLAELNMNGSNINQIARALNTRGDSDEMIGISDASINKALDNFTTLSNLIIGKLS